MRVASGPWFALTITFAVAAGAAGCSRSGGADGAGPKTLRLSMIPTTDPGKMARDSEPLVAYLEQATGARVELTVPLNYRLPLLLLG